MSKKAVIFWFFAGFVALVFLSIALFNDEQAIKRQEAEILRVNEAFVRLAVKVYDAEAQNYGELVFGNYRMELPISASSAIIFKSESRIYSGTNCEMRDAGETPGCKKHFILIQNPPPGFGLEYWKEGNIRTLPWTSAGI